MKFDKETLTKIVKGQSVGKIPPYSNGDWKKVDKYLKSLVGRIEDIKTINVKADFNHYGSGFSSYVHLYLSKNDKSDIVTTKDHDLVTEETNGIMLYFCRMAPVAVFGQGIWSTSCKNNKWHSASSHYLSPQDLGTFPLSCSKSSEG